MCRQGELLGDSLRALQGEVKQKGLDVCGVGEGELLDAVGTTLEAVHTSYQL